MYTKENFLSINYRDWALSDSTLQHIKDFMLGEPVGPPMFTDSELRAAGYTSWKQYEVHAALRAW